MSRSRVNQTGFTAIEGMLVVLVLAVIGLGGYYVWHSQKKAPGTDTTTTGAKTAASPYAGWQSAVFAGDKLMLKYPSDWHATHDTTTGDLELNKASGKGTLTVRLGWAADGLIANAGGNWGYKPVSRFTFNGKPAYLVEAVQGSEGFSYYLSSCAAPSLCFFPPKTTSQYKGINEDLEYYTPGAQEAPALPSDTASIREAKQIMASLSY